MNEFKIRVSFKKFAQLASFTERQKDRARRLSVTSRKANFSAFAETVWRS